MRRADAQVSIVTDACQLSPTPLRSRDDRIDVGELAAEHPRRADRLAVLDQEARARGDVLHPERRERDAERPDRLAVPVREQRDVDAERLRPGDMRPRRVPRDPERPDPRGREVVSPVTQEQKLVGSGRRPVPDVEAEQREARAEDLRERPGFLPRRSPDLDVGTRSPASSTRRAYRGAGARGRLPRPEGAPVNVPRIWPTRRPRPQPPCSDG